MRWLVSILPLLSQAALAADPGCVFTGTGENLPAGELHVRGLGPAFGTVKPFEYRHEVTLFLPEGKWSQPTPVVIDTGSVRLAVDLLPSEVPTLYLRKPLRFGVFTAAAAQRVHAVTRAGAKLTLEVDPPAVFKPRSALTVLAPCSAASLDWTAIDSEDQPSGARVLLTPRVEFPITTSPSRPEEGTITLAEQVDAMLLERRGEWVRVRWSVEEGSFEGWIPLSVTTPAEGGYGSGVGMLRGKQDSEVFVLDDTTTRCHQAVTLSVRLGNEVAPLGRLKVGTPFRVKKVEPAATAIELGLDGITLSAGVELMLTAAAWRECH